MNTPHDPTGHQPIHSPNLPVEDAVNINVGDVLQTTAEEYDTIILVNTPEMVVEEVAVPTEIDPEAIVVGNPTITSPDTVDGGEDVPDTSPVEDDPNVLTDEDDIPFAKHIIDFRGDTREALQSLLVTDEGIQGVDIVNSQIRTVGSWENIIYRAFAHNQADEQRIQKALGDLSEADRSSMSDVLRNEAGKKRLGAAPIVSAYPGGSTTDVSGEAARLAFACLMEGGGYRIPLINSGITVDIVVPTNSDIQTLLSNCIAVDKELGSAMGAHYFAYNDILVKSQAMNFLAPLIVGSSYVDFRKKGMLQSVIKLPDLQALLMYVASY